jgi:uncharacterized CHY-type Zn-finger protein
VAHWLERDWVEASMGLIAKFECIACGYETKERTLGPAPYPQEFDPRLVSCASCKTLRVLDVLVAARGCGRHKKAFVIHEDEDNVSCPRCGATMRCGAEALWD